MRQLSWFTATILAVCLIVLLSVPAFAQSRGQGASFE